MSKRIPSVIIPVCFAWAAVAQSQTLPSSQPNLLQIFREEIKVGHGPDHVKTEAGWPAAFEKASFPHPYMSFVSMTGPSEVWFVQPFESHKAMADAMKLEADAALAPELARLSKSDAEHLNGHSVVLAAARKDLSHGDYPDTSKQRFYEVTVFRVRPGHERDFVAAAKAYGSATARSAPGTSYRVYEVIAGMPGPTYMVFSSVTSYGEFDKMMSDGEAAMKGANQQETEVLQKFSAEGLINAQTTRFRVDPEMSYVPAEVRAQDAAFWKPKGATATKKPPVKK